MKWEFERVLNLCKELNIETIEMRLGLENWYALNSSAQQIHEVKNLLKTYNVSILNLGSQVTVKNYDKKQMKDLEDCVTLAKKYDAKGIRIFLGNFFRKHSDASEG